MGMFVNGRYIAGNPEPSQPAAPPQPASPEIRVAEVQSRVTAPAVVAPEPQPAAPIVPVVRPTETVSEPVAVVRVQLAQPTHTRARPAQGDQAMQQFDIRITGEGTEDAARAFLAEFMGKLVGSGGKVHYASMNNQEVRIQVAPVGPPPGVLHIPASSEGDAK